MFFCFLFFCQFYYPYALCYVTQIQMILLSQTLQSSTKQTGKSEHKSQRIRHVEKLVRRVFLWNLLWFPSLFRYNRVAKEWTEKHAMWRQWYIPEHLKIWQYCFNCSSTLVLVEVFFSLLGHFLYLDFTWLNCFYCLFYFYLKLALFLLLFLVVVGWHDCIFLLIDCKRLYWIYFSSFCIKTFIRK